MKPSKYHVSMDSLYYHYEDEYFHSDTEDFIEDFTCDFIFDDNNNKTEAFEISEVKSSFQKICLGDFPIMTKEKQSKSHRKYQHEKEKLKSDYAKGSDKIKNHIVWTEYVEDPIINPTMDSSNSLVNLEDSITMTRKRVLFSVSELDPSYLKETFSDIYVEADCFPRLFQINLSGKLASVWGWTGKEINFLAALFVKMDTSSVIKVGKKDLIQCEVWLNLCLSEDLTVDLQSVTSEQTYTLEKVVDLALQDAKCFDKSNFNLMACQEETFILLVKTPETSLLDTYAPQTQITKTEHVSVSRTILQSQLDNKFIQCKNASQDAICGICFNQVSWSLQPPLVGNRSYGLCLYQCGHIFCEDCWRQHLIASIRSGSQKLSCPDFGCNVLVDRITCLGLVSLRLYIQQKTLVDTLAIQSDPAFHWCPNSQCNRILYCSGLQLRETQDFVATLKCVCKTTFCTKCRENAHWPVSCEIAQHYLEKLQELGKLKNTQINEKICISGKHCPRCNNFIEKNGGCNHMTCVCKAEFCWFCCKLLGQKGHTTWPCTKRTKLIEKTEKFLKISPNEVEEKLISDLKKSKEGQVFLLALQTRKRRIQSILKLTKRGKIVHQLSDILARNSGLNKRRLDSTTCTSLIREYELVHQTAQMLMSKLQELSETIEHIYAASWYFYVTNRQISSHLRTHSNQLTKLYNEILELIENPQHRFPNTHVRMETITHTFNSALSLMKETECFLNSQ